MQTTDSNRWRTIDIVVASVIAVAFGVIFWAWGVVWSATEGAFSFFPPAQTLIYGVWLVPAVLGGLVIRKPGARCTASCWRRSSRPCWAASGAPSSCCRG